MLVRNNLYGHVALSMGNNQKEYTEEHGGKSYVAKGEMADAYDNYMHRVDFEEWESSKEKQANLKLRDLGKKLAQYLYTAGLGMGLALAPTPADNNIRVLEPSELGLVGNQDSFSQRMSAIREVVEAEKAKIKAEEEKIKAEEEQAKIEERAAKLRAYEEFTSSIDYVNPEIIEKYKNYNPEDILKTVLDIARNTKDYTDYEKDYILYKSLYNVKKEIKYLDDVFRLYKDKPVLEYMQKHSNTLPLEVAVLIPYLESRGKIKNNPEHNIMQIIPIANEQVNNISGQNFDASFLPDNLKIGIKLIEHYTDKFDGDLIKGVAAFNAGDNNVRKYNGVPPFAETRNYVDFIKMHLDFYEKYPDAFTTVFEFPNN